MAKLIFVLLLFSICAQALQIQFRAETKVSKSEKISGFVFDELSGSLFAVSSAPKFSQKPQIQELKIQLEPFLIDSKKSIFLAVNPTELSHPGKKMAAIKFADQFFLQGIALTSWGDFILTNPTSKTHPIFSIHPDGEIQGNLERLENSPQDFSLVAGSLNGKEWMISNPAGSWNHYKSSEAWVIKPDFQLHYPVSTSQKVQALIYWKDQMILVLESSGKSGQIFSVDLQNAKPGQSLAKNLVLNLKDLQGQRAAKAAIVGMSLGPKLSSGERSLILVSHSQSVRDQTSQFLLFALKE